MSVLFVPGRYATFVNPRSTTPSYISDFDGAVASADVGAAALALRDADGLVERVRGLSEANREAIVSEAQELRAAGPDVSAVQRFQIVSRLWERYLDPLRELVTVRGEMERRLDSLRRSLEMGEHRFYSHGALHQGIGRTLARVTRMRRSVSDDHRAAIQEVAPLYERLRRNNRWVVGASRALQALRSAGARAPDFDHHVSFVGWRPQNLLSDDSIRARVVGLIDYAPEESVLLAEPTPPPEASVITRDELRQVLMDAVPIDDVLALLLERWPTLPVRAHLIAFGHIASGRFGAVDAVDGSTERSYYIHDIRIQAWPLSLREVL